MEKLRFSGHDTFIVRTFWPKKGYDFVKSGGNFNADEAVVKLGVGKNMVSSINFWMNALGLLKDNDTTEIADFLFGEDGVDPFLEDVASIWLLHYHLVKTNYSSLYNIVFNSFRKERTVFTKPQLLSFIKRIFRQQNENNINENTIGKDINVFCRLYNTPDYKTITKNFEDEIGGLFQELELMISSLEKDIQDGMNKKHEWFYLQPDNHQTLPPLVTMYSILDQYEGDTNISFRRLEIDENSPGLIFLLNKEGLYQQLKEIERLFEEIVISETAGNVNISIPSYLNKWDILRQYYGN
ncbi:MAG: DUF4007 family protein [bacterium]